MTVLQAIRELLKFKGNCSLAEIAKICGKKQSDVLIILNRNKNLLKFDKKNRIIYFHNVKREQLQKAFERGITYRESPINYGAAIALDTTNETADILKETYYCGGFGDSYAVKVILKTEQNILKLKELDIIPESEYKTNPLEFYWQEEGVEVE